MDGNPSQAAQADIAEQVRGLAASVEGQLNDALTALAAADLSASDRVVRNDASINVARYEIENAVMRELESGADADRLRFLLSVVHVVGDLERIGDHAEGIAKVALMLGHPAPVEVPAAIVELGAMVRTMLHDGVTAFTQRDVDSARRLCDYDDVVDAQYDSVYAEQLSLMTAAHESVTLRTYMLWVAHNLERIADRVTNICERTVFLVTGAVEELNVSKY